MPIWPFESVGREGETRLAKMEKPVVAHHSSLKFIRFILLCQIFSETHAQLYIFSGTQVYFDLSHHGVKVWLNSITLRSSRTKHSTTKVIIQIGFAHDNNANGSERAESPSHCRARACMRGPFHFELCSPPPFLSRLLESPT